MASPIALGKVLSNHLKILECPLPLDQPWDFEKFQVGVAWIEEEVIRLLATVNREWLYGVDNKKEWSKNLFEYCKKLDIFFKPSAPVFSLPDLKAIYQRLVARAIEETYLDKCNDMKVNETQTKHQAVVGEASEQAQKLVNAMLGSDQLPPATMKQAVDVLHSRLVIPPHEGEYAKVKLSDEQMLRLCATSHLTDLRYQTDKIITALQMITADPKTDHKLGKVGF
eukprot:Blabericola_migrator_1__953@NODE_123_length_13376_cov_72_514539_g109_i0_p7_GENE_NODE_123_length_13376_cov_72_514539_g109_i0NODE_123_length_13376_cov_72_514539_g109_i0_p7_ORF_typecomplete_len225_score47_71RLL/PF10036_9/2_7e26_NODE_123_length_13376_cov_72_514539_g109_i044718